MRTGSNCRWMVVAAVAAVAACAQRPAPVVDRSGIDKRGAAAAAQAPVPREAKDGFYIVRGGDTLPNVGPSFGSPVGSVLPSMSPSLDAETQGNVRLGPRAIEIDAEPPPNDLVIAPPIDVPELTVVPRPFRDEAAQR